MNYAKVIGTVIATQKVKELEGSTLKLIQYCDSKRETSGDPVVAYDPIGTRLGDFVLVVSKREASLAVPGVALANNYPLDAAITGIVDDIG